MDKTQRWDIYNYFGHWHCVWIVFLPGPSMRSWLARCPRPSPPRSPARRRSRASPPSSSTLPSRKTPVITVGHHLHDVVSLFLPATQTKRHLQQIFWPHWQPLASSYPVHLPEDQFKIARNKLLGKPCSLLQMQEMIMLMFKTSSLSAWLRYK